MLVIISACATPETRTSTITNTVSVPTPVPCIAAAEIPVLPVPTPIDLAASTHKQRDAAQAADVQAWRDYGAVADPLLRKCAVP